MIINPNILPILKTPTSKLAKKHNISRTKKNIIPFTEILIPLLFIINMIKKIGKHKTENPTKHNKTTINHEEKSEYAMAQSINGEKIQNGYKISLNISGKEMVSVVAIIFKTNKTKNTNLVGLL